MSASVRIPDLSRTLRHFRNVPESEVAIYGSVAKAIRPAQHDFAALFRELVAGRLAIVYEDASKEIELANSVLAANAGPPTSPLEARQRPGTT